MHLRLRLAAKAYGLLVDFKRAFDSVSHQKLWQKLHHLKVSTKLIKILISLYDKACIQVKLGNQFSNKFKVTEGVLQGESLSPLLFILFIADFETFLRNQDCSGVNINNHVDLLILMYADDTVLLANSAIELEKLLKSLELYCDINGFAVNTDKTKAMIFRKAGRIKTAEVERFHYN